MSKADAIAKEDCQRDEARKPEDHGDSLNSQNRELVVCDSLGETPWNDDEVEKGEERPDGAEDEVVDLAW